MGEAFTLFALAVPHPPDWLASVVVRPYHVEQKLEHLIIKDNNDTSILKVKFSLHFTQKYYPGRCIFKQLKEKIILGAISNFIQQSG